MDITTGLCGIFVVLGIISAPSGKKEEKMEEKPIGRVEVLNQVVESVQAETKEESKQELLEERLEAINIDMEELTETFNEKECEMQETLECEACNENTEIVESDFEVVEKVIEIDENIQEKNQKQTILSEDDKREIVDLLSVLIEKFNNI